MPRVYVGTWHRRMPPVTKLRVARPTDNLGAVVRFNRDGLGLDILFRFEDHAGFDGVMLGRGGAPYPSRAHARAAMPLDARRRRTTS